ECENKRQPDPECPLPHARPLGRGQRAEIRSQRARDAGSVLWLLTSALCPLVTGGSYPGRRGPGKGNPPRRPELLIPPSPAVRSLPGGAQLPHGRGDPWGGAAGSGG